jgi:hypothetical protein
MDQRHLRARACHWVLKLAGTTGDRPGSGAIQPTHIAAALDLQTAEAIDRLIVRASIHRGSAEEAAWRGRQRNTPGSWMSCTEASFKGGPSERLCNVIGFEVTSTPGIISRTSQSGLSSVQWGARSGLPWLVRAVPIPYL